VLLLPDASVTVLPVPSLKPHAATRPVCARATAGEATTNSNALMTTSDGRMLFNESLGSLRTRCRWWSLSTQIAG